MLNCPQLGNTKVWRMYISTDLSSQLEIRQWSI